MSESALSVVYLDANILIHLVEGYEAHAPAIETLLAAIESRRARFMTSELSLAEVLVVPLRKGRADLVDRYTELLTAKGELEVIPVNSQILRVSAEIRARAGGNLLDAIHVATAALNDCSVFLSEDVRIKTVAPLQRLDLSDFAGRHTS